MTVARGADATRRALLHAIGLAAPALWVAGEGMARTPSTTVQRFGARGDGRTDDTRAIQAAIDAASPGGVVHLPAGEYLVDPLRSLRMRSGVHLMLHRNARLRAIPNGAPRAYVINVEGVDDVRISGGRILGERDAHRGTAGEWGHGIMIRGATRVVVRDMRIERCWGDGISIGAINAGKGRAVKPSSDIEIANVQCIGNRRQGLTIGRSRRVRVHDCEFSDTGGTPPAAGIDVEPDAGDFARDVRIERCIVRRNRGPGIQVWKQSTSVIVRDCTIEGNRNAGILAFGATDVAIEGNRIRGNQQPGIVLRSGSGRVRIADNTFADNAPGRPKLASGGREARWARHLKVEPGVGAVNVAPGNRLD